jgi:hypothetical protein
VTYLVVGIDSATLAPWHQNIGSRDVAGAVRTALDRAEASGIDLVVAAVIGPNMTVLPHRIAKPVLTAQAA